MAGLDPLERSGDSRPHLRNPQERGCNPTGAAPAHHSTSKRPWGRYAGETGIRLLRSGIHHLVRAPCHRQSSAGVLSAAMASGTDIQASEIDRPTGPYPQAGRRKQPRLVIRQAVRGPVEPETGAGWAHNFPLGLPHPADLRHRADGVNSSSPFTRGIDAVQPSVGLKTTIARWNEIAAALGERNRKRKPQISKLRLPQ